LLRGDSTNRTNAISATADQRGTLNRLNVCDAYHLAPFNNPGIDDDLESDTDSWGKLLPQTCAYRPASA
jgi:hypothetical protein